MKKPVPDVDKTNSPDGMCWVVVQRRGSKTVSRNRFVNESDARVHVTKLVGKDGCLVHIESPLRPAGSADLYDVPRAEE